MFLKNVCLLEEYHQHCIDDIFNSVMLGVKPVFFKPNENEPSRYIENPEWKKKQIEKQVEYNNSLIGMYEERILQCRNEIKELEKDLKNK